MTGRPRLYTPEEVLSSLRRFIETRGFPPTLEEFGEYLGVSPRTAGRYLEDLESRFLIQRWPGARGIKILEQGGEE